MSRDTSDRPMGTPSSAMHEVEQDAWGSDNLFISHPLKPAIEAQSTKETSSAAGKKLSPAKNTSKIRSPGKEILATKAFLMAQKRVSLAALRKPPLYQPSDEDEGDVNASSSETLLQLLQGTVYRGEGNSCLLLGPRGSGKTRVNVVSSICDKHYAEFC